MANDFLKENNHIKEDLEPKSDPHSWFGPKMFTDGNGQTVLSPENSSVEIDDAALQDALDAWQKFEDSDNQKLSQEEIKKLADSLSNGDEQLSLSIQNLMAKGVTIRDCTPKDKQTGNPVINLGVGIKDADAQDFIQGLYEQDGVDISKIYPDEGNFRVDITGESLIDSLVHPENVRDMSPKENIFVKAAEEYLAYFKELEQTPEITQQISILQTYLNQNRDNKRDEEPNIQEPSKPETSRKSWELEPEKKQIVEDKLSRVAQSFNEQSSNDQLTQSRAVDSKEDEYQK